MNSETVEINSEQIDDLPLIVEWLKKMAIAKWIDKSLSKLHGNHQGMSYGQLSVLLLTYIITQADHRLCAVEDWVKKHLKSLELVTGWSIGTKDATDDRLGRVVADVQSNWSQTVCLFSRLQGWGNCHPCFYRI